MSTPKQACADDLRRRILIMDLSPGAELDESRLASEYGLSRTPLREVYQLLAGEGFLRQEQHRGARVAPLDLADLRAFFQSAPLVYCAVARQASEHGTAAQIAALRAENAAFTAASEGGSSEEAALLNHRFHARIGDMAANPYLLPSLRRLLLDHVRLSLRFSSPGSKKEKKVIRKAADQHAALIDALEARDAQTAVEVTLAHWDLARDEMARMALPDPLPLAETAPAQAEEQDAKPTEDPKPLKKAKKKRV